MSDQLQTSLLPKICTQRYDLTLLHLALCKSRMLTVHVAQYGYHSSLADLRYNSSADVVGIVSSADAPRKTDGPDYVWRAQIVQASGKRCRLAVFRPFRQALPAKARAGDAIVLRSFKVAHFDGEQLLRSKDDSAWAVYSSRPVSSGEEGTLEEGELKLTVSGPPPELGQQEALHARKLIQWWRDRGHRLAPPVELDRHDADGANHGGEIAFATVSDLLDDTPTDDKGIDKVCNLDATLVYAPRALGHPYVFYVTDGSLAEQAESDLTRVENGRTLLVGQLCPDLPTEIAQAISSIWQSTVRVLPVHVRLSGEGGGNSPTRDIRQLIATSSAIPTADALLHVTITGVRRKIDDETGCVIASVLSTPPPSARTASSQSGEGGKNGRLRRIQVRST